MKSNILWALLGLNAVLLFLFIGALGRSSTAQAQIRRPADYLMIPGEVNGGPTAIVYIIDTTNGRLGGMAYDDSAHTLTAMPALDLNAIYKVANARR